MPEAVVLGAGMVGSVIAQDLARDDEFSVHLLDANERALAQARDRTPALRTSRIDVADRAALERAIRDADVVVGALSSNVGYEALATLVDLGAPVVDISFFSQNALMLGDRAKATGARVVFDMGVAPGMSNMLAVHAANSLDVCERVDVIVGGVPQHPMPPYFYKAAFSPRDVLEEYTRPARVVEDGAIVEKQPMSEEEPIEFAGVGSFVAFLTDGLRSLALNPIAPTMREMTLRHAQHTPMMRFLRDAGFFSQTPVELPAAEGVGALPIDMTAAIMLPAWQYDPGEADLTLMRISAAGTRAGKRLRIEWELIDEYDAAADTSSMARTTAFPAAIVARMLAAGEIDASGVHAPEALVAHEGAVDQLLDAMADRGVRYTHKEITL